MRPAVHRGSLIVRDMLLVAAQPGQEPFAAKVHHFMELLARR